MPDPLVADHAGFDFAGFDAAAYVAAAAPAVGLTLDPGQRAAVTDAFALILSMAAPALSQPAAEHLEPAPIFSP